VCYIYVHCDIDIFLLFLFVCSHSFSSMIHTLNIDTCVCDYSVHTYACCVQFNPHFSFFFFCSLTYYIYTRLIMVLPKQPIRTLQMENNPNKTQLIIQSSKPIVPTTVIVKFNHPQTRLKVFYLVTRRYLPRTSVLLWKGKVVV
jgi:hypothetical protein